MKIKSLFEGCVAVVIGLAYIMSIANPINHTVSAKKTNKNQITIEMGKVYKLKVKKGYVFNSSKPKIASVSNKGVVKAKRCGKCTVKVMKKKSMVKKYKITVVNNVLGKNSIATQVPVQTEIPSSKPDTNIVQSTVTPGNYYVLGIGTIASVKKIDETKYEYIIDLSETSLKSIKQNLGTYPNLKSVMCVSSQNVSDVGKMVGIMVTYDFSISNCTVENDTILNLGTIYGLSH